MTNEEARALMELIARESAENRMMAKELIAQSSENIKRLVDILVDRRLCKLDQAQETLTEGGEPKFSTDPCTGDPAKTEWCATHNRSIWACVNELTERLS